MHTDLTSLRIFVVDECSPNIFPVYDLIHIQLVDKPVRGRKEPRVESGPLSLILCQYEPGPLIL